MSKIKIVTDSACDIPDSQIEQYGIELLHIPITVDGVGYYERKSFSIEEYYDVLAKAKEIPVTSKVNEPHFFECYKRTHEEGYTDLIVVTINSLGSGTHDSAVQAKARFFEENPGAESAFRIHVLDSHGYTAVYGYPVVEVAKMIREGKAVEEMLAYLEDWFSRSEIYLGVFTLEHAKRSGRLKGMSAFIGEALGLRPIISMIDGKTDVLAKVRGDAKVIPRLMECYKQYCDDKDAPVQILQGTDKDKAQELAALLEKETGRVPVIYTAGAAIITNTGPRPLAIIMQGKSKKK